MMIIMIMMIMMMIMMINNDNDNDNDSNDDNMNTTNSNDKQVPFGRGSASKSCIILRICISTLRAHDIFVFFFVNFHVEIHIRNVLQALCFCYFNLEIMDMESPSGGQRQHQT